MDGSGDWLVVSVQALHRFYDRRTDEVVASWMTSQDRERMITNNIAYVASIIDTIHRRYETSATIVYCGFSQGVAMAYRSATRLSLTPSGIIALSGDIPPELQDDPSIHWMVCCPVACSWDSVCAKPAGPCPAVRIGPGARGRAPRSARHRAGSSRGSSRTPRAPGAARRGVHRDSDP